MLPGTSSQPQGPRTVRCYHCRKLFDVPSRAMSISCPWCYKRVALDDVIIKNTVWTGKVQTCGKVVVRKNAELVASHVEASAGVEVYGRLEVGVGGIISRSLIYVGPGATIKGDLSAPSIRVEPGGAIEGGMVKIASDRAVPGPSRPPAPMDNPMGMGPIMKPEHPLVRAMPWLKGILPT